MYYSEKSSLKKFILNCAFLSKKEDNLNLQIKIENTHERLWVESTRWRRGPRSLKLSAILENHSDLHPSILKLFYSACFLDIFLFVFSAFANMIYFLNYFAFVLGSSLFGASENQWSWIGIPIINALCLIFLVRLLSDYYKISLRGSYRNQYLKLWFLDFLTLNFLSVIGTLIFALNRALMLKVYGDDKIDFDNSANQQAIKKYAWVILKTELFLFFLNLMIFLAAFLVGYFVNISVIKDICLFIIVFSIFLFNVWLVPNLVWVLILQKMFINLTKTKSTHYFLTIVHFLGMFNSYYIAIFLNLLTLDYFAQEYILENW